MANNFLDKAKNWFSGKMEAMESTELFFEFRVLHVVNCVTAVTTVLLIQQNL